MEGLLGLANTVNNNQRSMQELGVMERMHANVEQDREKEKRAQMEEQLMYEKLYEQADGLLEKDRVRVNKRIALMQKQVTDQLRDSGGDRRRFMENGGMSFMNNASNSILKSDEFVRYQNNQQNMFNIMKLQEAGKGHLISPDDLKTVEDYYANEEGADITFTGMLNEIEMPPDKNFDYGTEIPLHNILSYSSNMMKIKANYNQMYPDKAEPNYAQLYAFAQKMGYTGTGSNTTRMQMENRQKLAEQRANSSRRTDPKKIKNSYLNQINVLRSQLGGKTFKDIQEMGGSLIEGQRKNNPSIGKLLGNKFGHRAKNMDLDEKGWDIDSPVSWFKDEMGLRDAYEILPHNKTDVAKVAFDGFEVKSGKVVGFEPGPNDFRMDGVKLKGRNELEQGEYKADYEILGTTTALEAVSANDDNQSVLLVNAYDSDGNIKESSQKDLNEGYMGDYGGGETRVATVMAVKHPDGHIFYRKLDIGQPQIKTIFSNQMAEDDDMTDAVDQDNQSAALLNNIEKMQKEEEIKFRGTLNVTDKEVFSNPDVQPIFETEGEKYWGAGSGGQENRYNMMRSFYLASNYVANSYKPDGVDGVDKNGVITSIDKNLFTKAVEMGGIDENMTSYGNPDTTDEKLISDWLGNINSQTDDDYAKQRNTDLAKKWLQVLRLVE